ncbi:hydroxyacid dehydrogenase [Rodentibacter caecimuris]|uniref:Hydroxyacid dehydrogenase n=1 Tax=Rodentibacter caecimuris TaxID=1796644 RepID=A0AAJ3K3V9_9PAST|nr:RhuM family protein [Rodentibacter heylii]AOF52953.1 Putative DNA-binding protein in cluster with Type I restriction-modification system [Pasteurellaceae bacterium NI1060]MCX2961316.1 virulence RhuM family protein [Rodentibacter heylii]OOF70281.1 hydroxyacid dehydrogenase [Rodentibacter heylii]OOF74213.1 hydroxyacid dehydrogenase [Rodentibacter heylii]OOF76038.1 hydroxyacid dehydrogenase [Rodentibacter heylii]
MSNNNIIIYTTEDGLSQFTLRELGSQLWLSQLEIAELYQTTKQNISKHIKAILAENELSEHSVVNFQLTTATDGKNYNTQIYALPMILAIGYRVRSTRGTQFRQWATRTLGEYIQKGFVLDEERLKNPPIGTNQADDYFDLLLEKIRDIRASERRMYLRVREIFTLAADYQPSFRETNQFFQKIQNKLHFACTDKTAAELIFQRSNAELPNMGLTNFRGSEVIRKDVTIAKNYLNEQEITALNRIVSMWLDFAEDQASRKKQFFLKDWEDKLDSFLVFNERNMLKNQGSITKKQADEKALLEYDKFNQQRRLEKEKAGENYIEQLLKLKK